MGNEIRLATLDDAEELLAVTLRAYQPIRDLNIKFPAATADLELMKHNITNFSCYILLHKGKIAATISIRKFEDYEVIKDLYCVWWFAVDTEHKGKGFGSEILQYAEETIIRDTLQQSEVGLGTSEIHPWLISMYERKGYVRFLEIDHGEEGKGVFLKKPLVPELLKVAE